MNENERYALQTLITGFVLVFVAALVTSCTEKYNHEVTQRWAICGGTNSTCVQ